MGAKGSELKRVRQSRKSNLRNRHYKSMMRTAVKRVFAAKKEEASTEAPLELKEEAKNTTEENK